jgi:hypothetical protein
MDGVLGWKTEVDSFLRQVARWVHRAVPFDIALIGFEVDASALPPENIRASGLPKERDAGILWNSGGDLIWYPATRP